MFSIFTKFCKETFDNNNTNYSNKINNKILILIGDSMLNNANYVFYNDSIPGLIKNRVPNAIILAKDGSTINDVYYQLDKISNKYDNKNTYLFLSIGGNDILNKYYEKNYTINSIYRQFENLVNAIKAKLPQVNLFVLNLYYPQNYFYEKYYIEITKWNNIIEKNNKYKILNTNNLIRNKEDIVYEIEPSESGGEKIVNEIMNYFII